MTAHELIQPGVLPEALTTERISPHHCPLRMFQKRHYNDSADHYLVMPEYHEEVSLNQVQGFSSYVS